MTNLVASYEMNGQRNPKWDDSARQALTELAKIRGGQDYEEETRLALVGDLAHEAIRAGCDDPLVRYLYCRYGYVDSAQPFPERQNDYRLTAQALEASAYPPLWKFYANIGAANILWTGSKDIWPQVRTFRVAAAQDLYLALLDKNLPVEEAYQACHTLFETIRHDTYEMTNMYNQIEQPLFSNWPDAAASHLIKAEYYYDFAWRGRGNATADKVSKAQWDMFFGRLKVAEAALQKAWSLNSRDARIPTLMIGIVEGQEGKRPEMEKWFNRAMELDTNNYEACRSKLHYLYPQWYGSRKDMLEFGRECVASTKWGGKVPLILVDAHSELDRLLPRDEREQYWQLPDVWPDIHSAYEKYSRLNPEETRFRYPYAAYAFRCGQWKTFVEQTGLLLKSERDFKYYYFGGRDEFEKLLKIARAADDQQNQ